MSMIVYLNGQWLPGDQATVNIEDRGLMFADGLYEVVRYYDGKPLAMQMHLDRLQNGLQALRIDLPAEVRFDQISDELLKRNQLKDATVYWQVTRGVYPRRFTFPPAGTKPTVFAIAGKAPVLRPDAPTPKLTAITQPDDRWKHCYIKAVSLLPNVMASQAAHEAGTDCAILVRDGIVTEATSRSILIVEKGELHTYPLDGRILDSITRRIALQLAERLGIAVHELPFDLQRLYAADEVLAVGSTTEIAAVLSVDGRKIGSGSAGPVATKLFDAYKKFIRES